MYHSTCAAINGELVAVGGESSSDTEYRTTCTGVVHKYSPVTKSLDTVSSLQISREKCLVAVLPENEIKVVGGCTGGYIDNYTDEVEVATLA